MAFRPRTPTFRPQLSVRRVYVTLQPRSEMKETPDAHLLHVYLPGYTKDRIKITFVGSSRMVRITGERPIEGNRWSRFDQTYPVPENSEAETLEGKFELGTLILKMPKKIISQVTPKPEVETTQQKSPTLTSPSEKAVAEDKPDKVQETIPPQSTEVEAKPEKAQETVPSQPQITKVEEPIEDKKSASLPSPVKGPADFKAQKATQEDTSTQITSEPIKDHSPQKGQEEAVAKPTVTGKPQEEQKEFEAKPTPTKVTKIQTDEQPPKGQEQVEPKPTLTTITRDLAEEKSHEEIRLKPGLTTIKEPLEEKKVGLSAEDAEKERISKKEVKEEDGKPSESRKPDMEKGNLQGKEIKTRKLSAKEAEPSAPKVPKKEKESISRASPNLEGKNGEDMIDVVGNGIRKLATSSSQVVARIAEGKWNEEEKQLVVNIGAAVLVIAALGAYVSCRFAS